MAELDGVFIPVTAPYRGDDVATERLAGNLRAWSATDLAGFVVLGSTGEFPMLSRPAVRGGSADTGRGGRRQ